MQQKSRAHRATAPTYTYRQGCRSLLSIGGYSLQFYPNFALFSTLGGDEPWPRFCSGERIKWRLKKRRRSSSKMEHFVSQIQAKTKKKGPTPFFPEFKWTPTLTCTVAQQSQIIEGDADVDHTQTIEDWGDTVKLLLGVAPFCFLFSLWSFEPLFFDLLFYIQRHGTLSSLSLDSKGPKANYVKFADVETWQIRWCCKHFFVCSLMT